jgi:hypothetical protein
MTFGGGVCRRKQSDESIFRKIGVFNIVTVTAVLCCDWFCHATGIFCPRRFPPPNVISQGGLTLHIQGVPELARQPLTANFNI